jgi:sugar lactone lactonase YvrE
MKPPYIKQVFYVAIWLLLMCCLFEACKNSEIHPANTPPVASKQADSIAKADSLPSFYSPTGVAVDAAGNIYVADYGNNLIRKITSAGIVSTFAGSGTVGSLNGLSTIASFNKPKGIALDASGNLYVADASNNIIRKITPAGLVSTLAGSDSTGMDDGPGITATFFGPAGVTVDANNNVYVADAGNNLIRMVTPAGVVSTLAGLNGDFSNPTGISIDARGNLYVANYLDNNILEINSAGTVTTFAGNGQQAATNGPAGSASFYFPNSIAVDAAANVYVADGINNLIRKITPAGVVSTLAGSGVAGAADSTGTAASFNGPCGLALDATGNVYVADSNNNSIRKITPAGVVTTIAGTGNAGSKNGKAVAHRNTIMVANPNTKLNIWNTTKPK